MMQQPLYQQEQQPGTQDASGHQMVLCPVRLVYETQMLVQPGEQLQPNQTIFINPQNPPPWIQNRPAVQNQVIYVQQVPTSTYVPQQQHIDPNQLYIQNYGYQNLPPMLVQNPQDQIRPMQMLQQNIGPNAQLGQTLQTQRLIPNVNSISNTLNLVNAAQNQNVAMNRQITHNQIANISELVNNVKQENMGQNVYRPVAQAVPHDPRNQMQQTVTIVPTMQNVQRPPNIYEPNIGQVQPMPPQNIANVPPTFQNPVANVQETRKIQVPINKTNYNIVHPNTIAKGPQIFRPIQPRTQIRNSGPQFQLAVQPGTSLVQPTTPMVNINSVPQKMLPTKTVQLPTVAVPSNIKNDGNSAHLNRKRKSESPDELHRKINNTNPVETAASKRIENVPNTVVNCSDVGVNTSPIHKPDPKITLNNLQTMLTTNSNNQNLKIKEELAKKVNYHVPDLPMFVRSDPPISVPSIPNTAASEKDKLIRNTVFTQARGRVLNDKEPVIEPRQEVTSIDTVNNSVPTVPTEALKPVPAVEAIEVKKPEEPKISDAVVGSSNEKKAEKKESASVKKIKSTDKPSEEIKLKKDRNFVLTHVLDGYVIQESNIAFPIRKPLKEKALMNNSDENDQRNEGKETTSDKDAGLRNNSKILNISHLHINDIEVKKNNMDIGKDNPFHGLKPVTVKMWTVEQLATHLSKYGWNDSVSVLQEHEIDGESLLLVSKAQLITIGIKEEHADVINDFVKS